MPMSATEFGEAAEPFVAGRGSSSTMPQKRNPISCELILACAKALRQHAGLILDALVSDFERATGPWHAEWIALPESFGYAAGGPRPAPILCGGRAAPGRIHDRRAHRRPAAHGEKPRHDTRAYRGRGSHDGAGAPHRAQR